MGYIKLEGAPNTRDLGGIEMEDGRKIRPCRLIRSGRLLELTNADAQVLIAQHNMLTVVDLRSPLERREYPDPQWGIVEYLEVLLLDDAALGFVGKDAQNINDSLMALTEDKNFSPRQYMLNNYKGFIVSETAQQGFRYFMELVLSRRDGALLYHCNGGKDRTGLATMFILLALGASWETIEKDYLESNLYQREFCVKHLKQLPSRYHNERARGMIRNKYLVEAEWLCYARKLMTEMAGSPLAYVRDVLGVDDEKRAYLRERYLMP